MTAPSGPPPRPAAGELGRGAHTPASILRAPAAAAVRPLTDPGVLGRVLPFALVAAVAIAVAMAPPTGSTNESSLVLAAIVTAVLVLASLVLPWRRFPAWTEASIPLAAFVVVALVRDAVGGVASGLAPVVLIPILWVALYGGRIQLRIAIAATAVTFFVPLIVIGAPSYPAVGWRGSVVWVVIGMFAGSTIQSLVAQARQRSADVAALGAVTRALVDGSDPRPQLCDAAQLITGAAFAILFEPQPDGTLLATAGTDGVDLAPMRIDPDAEVSATAIVWRTGARVYLADASTDPRASARLVESTGAAAALFQPVIREGRRAGVLAVGFFESRPRMPTLALDMIELVAAEIAAAIDRSDLLALLAAQARTDPLTGAANRRSWDEEMEREVARVARTAEPLTVALIDMDHFKAYNDTFGHSAGDVLLSEFVVAIRAELRTGDVIARWGGEEFALALPSCDLPAARVVAERLLHVVPGGQTVSIGLTQAGVGDTPRTLIARADHALYEAKAGGRNRVLTRPAPSAPQSHAGSEAATA